MSAKRMQELWAGGNSNPPLPHLIRPKPNSSTGERTLPYHHYNTQMSRWTNLYQSNQNPFQQAQGFSTFQGTQFPLLGI